MDFTKKFLVEILFQTIDFRNTDVDFMYRNQYDYYVCCCILRSRFHFKRSEENKLVVTSSSHVPSVYTYSMLPSNSVCGLRRFSAGFGQEPERWTYYHLVDYPWLVFFPPSSQELCRNRIQGERA